MSKSAHQAEAAAAGAEMPAIPLAPRYLWLFEAVILLRVESGCGHQFAVDQFQHLYPHVRVQWELEQCVKELLAVMAPFYAWREAQRPCSGRMRHGRPGGADDAHGELPSE
jgi:hypothetical protein